VARRADDRIAQIVDRHILKRSSKIAGTTQYQVEINYIDPKLLKQFGYGSGRGSFTKKYTKAFNTLKEAQAHRDKIAYPKLAKQLNVNIDFFTQPSKAKTFASVAKEFLPPNKKNYVSGSELAELLGEPEKFVVKGGTKYKSSYVKALRKLLDQVDMSKLGFDPLGRGLPFYMYKKPTKENIELLKKYKTQQASKLSKGTGYNFIYPETANRIKLLDKSPFFKNFINNQKVITKEMIEDVDSPLNKFMSKNDMSLNQFLRAAMRYGEALRGDFMINVTDPILSDKSIKLNKKFSNKIYDVISDSVTSGLNDPIKSAIYRAAMSDISDQLGQQTTTFENYKTYLRNRVSNLIKSKTKTGRGKGIGSGIDVDEIVGVGSSARNKTAPYAVFSRFMDSQLNQGELRSFQRALTSRTSKLKEAIAEGNMKKAKKIVTDFDKEIYKPYINKLKAAGAKNVDLPRLTLQAPSSKTLGGGKGRLAELASQGLNFDEFFQKEKFGYIMPKGSLTQKELLNMSRDQLKVVLKKAVKDSPRSCQFIMAKKTGGLVPDDCIDAIDRDPIKSAEQLSEIKPTNESLAKVKSIAQRGLSIFPKLGTVGKIGTVAAGAGIALSGLRYNPEKGEIVTTDNDQKADQNQILQYVKDNPLKVTAGTSLGFAAQEVPGAYKAARDLGRGRVRSTLGISGAIRPILTTFGTPLITGLYEGAIGAKRLDEGETMTDILTDPVGPALGLTLMEPLSKLSGVVRDAPKRTMLEGARNYFNLSNVGQARPGITGQILRMGMSPKMIAGASRFLGLPGLALGLGMAGYDAYKNYQNQEGMIYNLFNKDG